MVSENLKKKSIFLDQENFDILTLLQKKQAPEPKPEKKAAFQEPITIKSKPLKSEKDRLFSLRSAPPLKESKDKPCSSKPIKQVSA